MWNRLTLSNIALLFLDVILIVFLVYEFGFKNFEEVRPYKIIVLPCLVIALIAFNLYKYRIFRKRGENGTVSKLNLVYLTVDMADFTIPGILFMIYLMWTGASPASTGRGIKKTTFALATLNIFNVARDNPYIETGTRRIASDAVKRAFTIISISLGIIGTGILSLLIFNPEFTLIQIAFEVFSAYSTVGLSMGIHASLSGNGKYVIIFIMFIGRTGLLNLMIGLLQSMNQSACQYPEENVMIN